MSRDNAREIEFYGSTLDECVNALLKYQRRGESVVVSFNGHKLYSCDVTIDSAYIEVLGQTKEEYDKAMEEWRKNYRQQEKKKKAEAEAQIPYWIEKGTDIIYPERAEEWKKCVEARASDLYHGTDLNAAIAVMEMLENGTLDEAKEVLEGQNHSGLSYAMVRNIVFAFSKKGPEFYEHTADGEISPEDRKAIEDKKRENAELEELHRVDSTKEVSAERRGEEQQISQGLGEKEQLIQKIDDIEKQLEALKAKETPLGQQSHLNQLEEK